MQNWNRLPYFRVATNPTSANARIPSLSRGDLWISHTLQGPCKSDLEHSFRVSYFPHTLQKSTASCAEQIYAYLKSGRKAEDMWRQGGETRFVFVWTPFEVNSGGKSSARASISRVQQRYTATAMSWLLRFVKIRFGVPML